MSICPPSPAPSGESNLVELVVADRAEERGKRGGAGGRMATSVQGGKNEACGSGYVFADAVVEDALQVDTEYIFC